MIPNSLPLSLQNSALTLPKQLEWFYKPLFPAPHEIADLKTLPIALFSLFIWSQLWLNEKKKTKNAF